MIARTSCLRVYSVSRLLYVLMVLWLTFLSFPLSFHRRRLRNSILILTIIVLLEVLVVLMAAEIRFILNLLILKVHLLRNSSSSDGW